MQDRLGVSRCLIVWSLLFFWFHVVADQEFRGWWVDAFHAGFKNPTEVRQLVADARAGHFNALLVEVRKRGDAYYNSHLEPKATDIASNYDPLADLLVQAHQGSPRIEVHAWLVMYPVWNQQTTLPSQANHPYRLHPDWVSQDAANNTWSGNGYYLDPAHPDVQQHLYEVAMDLVSNYDLDGLHFDYIRYPGPDWGYHPLAIARFNTQTGRQGIPVSSDPAWRQFRRDQVTTLVRKIYLATTAARPSVRVSAATITWAPGVSTDAQWPTARPYTEVLQDWRAWMEEGILDMNMPMAYFRQPTYAYDYYLWNLFIKNHRYRRQAAIGLGNYLNSISNSIVQIRMTRQPTSSSPPADGLIGYSYASVATNGSRANLIQALTQPSAHDPSSPPVFADWADPPEMTWKTQPQLGHLLGSATHQITQQPLDGATVTLAGPNNRTLISDATGYFGAVDLAPGQYQIRVEFPGLQTIFATVDIVAGEVKSCHFILAPPPGELFVQITRVSIGSSQALIDWDTDTPSICRVDYGTTMNLNAVSLVSSDSMLHHSAWLTGLMPGQEYYYRILAWTETDQYQTTLRRFRTAGELILDNPQARFVGSWITGTSASGKYASNYQYVAVSANAITAYAEFRPNLATPGYYDIWIWYPAGSNRSTQAPFEVISRDGTQVLSIDQTSGGGQWRSLAQGTYFLAGTNGYVRLHNQTGESGRVVIADAVRWIYRAGQDPPAAGQVPDWWAAHYTPSPLGGADDPDDDGYSNYAEYVTGTHPLDRASHLLFRIDFTSDASGRAEFYPALPDRAYRLNEIRHLPPGSWEILEIKPDSANAQGVAEFILPHVNSEQSFVGYRLQIDAP